MCVRVPAIQINLRLQAVATRLLHIVFWDVKHGFDINGGVHFVMDPISGRKHGLPKANSEIHEIAGLLQQSVSRHSLTCASKQCKIWFTQCVLTAPAITCLDFTETLL